MDGRGSIFIGEYDRGTRGSTSLRLAIKDNIDLQGAVTSAGSASLMDAPAATRDAVVVQNMVKHADVTIVGKTNLDEFAAGATGENQWFGNVVNPTDPERMIGGSSSGSAAAVVHNLADIALGTDTGGSVRIPAALCGISGFKPTTGLVSMEGVYPLSQNLDVVGPLAKDVDGLKTAMRLMLPGIDEAPARVPSNLRIGRIRFEQEQTVVDEVLDATLDKVDATVGDISFSQWQDAHLAAYTILSVQGWQNNRHLLQETPDKVGPVPSGVFETGRSTSFNAFAQALEFQAAWRLEVEKAFTGFDVLICPTVSSVAPKMVDLAALDWGNFSRTMQFNLSGHPALSLPMVLPDSNLTAGMQVVGKLGSDWDLLAIGDSLEQYLS